MHVWVPVKDRHDLTDQFIDDFNTQQGDHRLTILDNGSQTPPNWLDTRPCPGLSIHHMWNFALDNTAATDNVCIANNDIRMHSPNMLEQLDIVLNMHPDIGLISPNHGHDNHKNCGGDVIQAPPTIAQHGGPAGFCFALPPRTWHQYRFPDYRWWYGDTDLFFTVHHLHGRRLAIHTQVHITHLGSQTAGPKQQRQADIDHDEAMFNRRWGRP